MSSKIPGEGVKAGIFHWMSQLSKRWSFISNSNFLALWQWF